MSNYLDTKNGIQPAIKDELKIRDKAMAGDMLFVVTPATLVSVPTVSAGWTRTVIVELQDASGKVHEWFNQAITTGVAIADTSSAGTATIPSTTLTFANGKATVVITGSVHSWLNTETDTLTVAEATILGYTIAAKTSVETFTS